MVAYWAFNVFNEVFIAELIESFAGKYGRGVGSYAGSESLLWFLQSAFTQMRRWANSFCDQVSLTNTSLPWELFKNVLHNLKLFCRCAFPPQAVSHILIVFVMILKIYLLFHSDCRLGQKHNFMVDPRPPDIRDSL